MVAELSDCETNEPSLYEGSNETACKWSRLINVCLLWLQHSQLELLSLDRGWGEAGEGSPLWGFLSPAGVEGMVIGAHYLWSGGHWIGPPL